MQASITVTANNFVVRISPSTSYVGVVSITISASNTAGVTTTTLVLNLVTPPITKASIIIPVISSIVNDTTQTITLSYTNGGDTLANTSITISSIEPIGLQASITSKTASNFVVRISPSSSYVGIASITISALNTAGETTATLVLNLVIPPITKANITIPSVSDIVNDITQTITLSYNNGGDSNTSITISRIEPRGLQASITSKTASNFVVALSPSTSYVGIVSITISASNTAGETMTTLVLNIVAPPSITFASYNYLVTHGSVAEQIPFTNLVGTIQSISITTPSSYSVITNIRSNTSNIEFNTKDIAGKEHILVTVLSGGITTTVQLFVQVMQESVANFNTSISTTYLSSDAYYTEGSVVGDLDGDGYLDIALAVNGTANYWYKNNGSGVFTKQASFGGNNNSFAIDIGDLDGDGDLDLFVVNYGQNNYIYLNNGSGVFTQRQVSADTDLSGGISLGDIDNDGDLDAYVSNSNQQNKLWINDGSANFIANNIRGDLGASFDSALGDVDNDGDLDIYVANYNDLNKLWLNQGSNTFMAGSINHGRNYNWKVNFADLNNDNNLDVYISTNGQNKIYLGDGLGGFAIGKDIAGDLNNARDVSIYDVNKDGFLDIYVTSVITSDPSFIYHNRLWLGTGGANFINNDIDNDLNDKVLNSLSANIADFNRDGVLDFFVSTQNQQDKLYLSQPVIISATPSITIAAGTSKNIPISINNLYPATLTYSSVGQISYALSATQNIKIGTAIAATISVASSANAQATLSLYLAGATKNILVDIQGIASIKFANYNHLVTHGTTAKQIAFTNLVGRIVSVSTTTPLVHSVIRDLRVNGSNIQFNTKGQAGTEHILVTVLYGGATTTVQLFVQVMQESVANFSTAISTTYLSSDAYYTEDSVVGDLDGDGYLDIALAVNGAANYWYKNNGSGVFTKQASFGGNNNSLAIDIGDLDGDGDLDLFVVNYSQNNYIYLNNGSGIFTQRQVSADTDLSRGISLGDIDNDGDLDAYVSNSNQQNKLWLNDGSANFIANNIRGDLGASFDSALGDVDNDGDLDIYVANYNDLNKLWLNQGSNTFMAGSINHGRNYNWKVNFADLNNDNNLDVYISTNGQNKIYLGDGLGGFAIGKDIAGDLNNARDVSIYDVNKDGFLDIYVTSVITSDPSFIYHNRLWLGTGGANFINNDIDNDLNGKVLNSLSANIADFNRDGVLDFFVSYVSEQDKLYLSQPVIISATPSITIAAGTSKNIPISINNLYPATLTYSSVGQISYALSATQNIKIGTAIAATISVASSANAQATLSLYLAGATKNILVDIQGIASIKFANYNHLVTHGTTAKQIAFTNLVGRIVSVSTTTPLVHSVIRDLRVNGSNIQFNTKGQAGTEHILVTVLYGGATTTVQLFVQVMQESVANFSTAISTTYLSSDAYYTEDSVVGDLDGDGYLDIALAVNGAANYWYKNNGSGVFTKQASFGGNNNSLAIDIGDLDGDGDLDLFVVNYSQNNYIYLNNGSGIFTQRQVSADTDLSRGISLGDIDNDGDLDAYVSNSNQQNKLWLNDGSANFIANNIRGDLGASFDSALGDVDNDGDLDIYVANYNDLNKLWLNQGSNTFMAGSINHGRNYNWKVNFADLNNDNNLDVYISTNGQNKIYLGDGLGGFAIGKDIAGDLNNARDVSIYDVNKDGFLDIYVTSVITSDPSFIYHNRLWLGTGGANFINNDIDNDLNGKVLNSLSANIADFNRDGVLDFFVSYVSEQDKIYLSQPVIISATPSITIAAGTSKNIPISINNLYPATLTYSSVGQISYALSATQNIKIGTAIAATISVASSANAQATLSLYLAGATKNILVDIQGIASIKFANYNHLVTHGTTAKQIAFTNLVGRIVSVSTTTPLVHSVIRDLRVNGSNIQFNTKGQAGTEHILVTVLYGGATTTVQLFVQVMQESVANFSTAISTTYLSSDAYYTEDSVVGDLDGDGYLDIALAVNGAANYWYKNNGSGVFTKQASFGGNNNSLAIDIGDLDGDGDLDLFVVNYSQNNYIYLNNGSGIFTQRQVSADTDLSRGISLGDIDNDGDLDAYVSNSNQQNKLWLNDGSANFIANNIRGDLGASFDSALGDVDNDGDLDIYVANYNDLNKLWLNQGSNTFMAGSINHGRNYNWKVNFADLNNDNNLDVYISTNGQNKIYLGDGLGGFAIGKDIAGDLNNARDVSIYDVNKDGFLDIYVTSVITSDPSFIYHNRLWLGTGGANFINNDIDNDLNGKVLNSLSANIADFNRDGVLDFFVSYVSEQDKLYLSQPVIISATPSITIAAGTSKNIPISINNLYPATLTYSSVGQISYALSATQNIKIGTAIAATISVASSANAQATLSLYLAGATKNILINIITKPSITIPIISNIANNVTQNITVNYTNGGDTLANTSITISSIEPVSLQASITSTTVSNFVVALSPSSSYVGIVSITISASNTAGATTATLVLNLVNPAIQKPSITIPIISNIANNVTQNITVNYTNGGDTLANTSITISRIEPRGLQASITSTTASNFVVRISPSSSYVGIVSITISASNTAGNSTATLVLNLVAPPSITFANYNHLVTHSTTAKQIAFTGLVGTIQSISMTTPSSYSVITNLRANASNIEFNTKGQAGTEHILVTVAKDGITTAVQLFIQVMQTSVPNFNTGISSTYLSVDIYATTDSAVGDLDGDGYLDIAVTIGNGANYWYKNNGSGVFTKQASFGSNNSYDIDIGDLDGDGDLDLFVVNYSQNDYIYLNNGTGRFTQRQIGVGAYAGKDVSLGDIDNDGDLDAYVSNLSQQDKLWLNDGSANFISYDISGESNPSNSSALGDVDNDGDLDIYAAEDGVNKLWLNQGNNTFKAGTIDHGYKFSEEVKFADLNNDNNLDLYIVNLGQENQIYLGDGLGGFTAGKYFDYYHYSKDAVIYDVNKDGILDIYFASRDSITGNQNQLWLGTGGADFINNDIAGDLGNSYSSNIADFNSDGILDFFVGNINQKDKLYLSQPVVISATPSITIAAGTSKAVTISFNNLYPATLTSSSVGQISYELSATQNIKIGTSITATISVASNVPAGQATLSLYLAGVTKNILVNILAGPITKPSVTISAISNIVNNATQTITVNYTNGGDTLANTSITISRIEPRGLQASITSKTASNFVVRISPSSSYVGIASITISASNTAGDSTATLVLNIVAPAIQKPSITISVISNIVNNTTQTITLSYTNGGDILANTSITILNVEPAGLQASITGVTASNFVVRISPSSSYVGIASITISASNTAGDSTATLVLNLVKPIIKANITIPAISDMVNNVTQTITLSYNNGNDVNTSITIERIEPRGLQASITSTTASNFVVRISPSSSYVGIASITISASNTAGDSTATLVLNLVAPPSITFANYNHLVTHGTTAKQIPFTNLVGRIVSVSTTTPLAHSVIRDLTVNGSNIEFNTKGQAGTEHILVTILEGAATTTVQLFIQVMQTSVANFNTGISSTYLSSDPYYTEGSVVGDLDGDGYLDIAFSASGANYWYKNNGSGVFTKQAFFGGSNNSYGIDIGDLDGDGDLDLFVVNRNQNNYIYLNNGSGVFTQRQVSTGGIGMGVSLGDIDNDGDLDAYISNSSNSQNKLLLNNGSANFVANNISSDLGDSTDSALGDVDNDGDLDIYVVNRGGINRLWLNQGESNFIAGAIDHGSNESEQVKFVDLNNDNNLDLYIANYDQQNQIYLGDGLGGFVTNKNITGDENYSNDVSISDINKDGFLDIYVANGNFLTTNIQNKLWLGTGNANFINNDIAGDLRVSASNNIADFNNDGILDFFVGNTGQKDKLYLSQPVVISATPSITIAAGTSKAVTISFNNLYPATLTSSSVGRISYELSATQNIKIGTSITATISVASDIPAGQATLSLYLSGVTMNILIDILPITKPSITIPVISNIVNNTTQTITVNYTNGGDTLANTSITISRIEPRGLQASITSTTASNFVVRISPSSSYVGIVSITISASNTAGDSTATLVLNIVAPAIQKPSITIPVISNIVNNTTQTITLSYTNGGDTLANTSMTITSIEPAGLQASITSTTASNFVVRISPSSSYVGIASITISASNTAGDSTAKLVLNIVAPAIQKPSITIPVISNIVNNTTQTITLSYTNGGDTLANTSITITSIEPAGLQASITSTTASNFVVRISPSSSYVGIASITISASNTAGDSTATLVLNIVAPAIQKPSITIPVISNIVNNTTQTITLSYTNGGDTLANTSITITSIEPAGLQASITSTTASNFVVRISPSSSYVGIVSITISASNTAGDSTATLVLNLTLPITKANITIPFIGNIVNNTTQTITLSYTNGGDTLANTSITITSIEPAGLQASITSTTASNFVVRISPSSSYVGIASITISASNTAGDSTAKLVLNIVAPAIQKPSITIPVISNIVNNTTQTITLSYTNGGDTLANTSITITSIEPAGLQASITSTTASNFVVRIRPSTSYVGIVSITISASNTAGATTAKLVLNIVAPAIQKPSITIPVISNIVNNTTQTITLSYTNGGDTLANTSITITSIEPAGLQASITSTTASNFVVRIRPSTSYVGIVSITISASNTAGATTAKLVLNIVAPAIQKPSITIPVISNIVNNTTQTITLSYTNGGDTLANTSITITSIEPAGLQASITSTTASNFVVRISPSSSYVGIASITISASNTAGDSTAKLVLNIVAPAIQKPSITISVISNIVNNTTQTITLSYTNGGDTLANTSITISRIEPRGLQASITSTTASNFVVRISPSSSYVGIVSITISASNTAGDSTATLVLNIVAPAIQKPSITIPVISNIVNNTTQTITLSYTNGGDTLANTSITITSIEPAGLQASITSTTASNFVVALSPSASYVGVVSITISASNTAGDSTATLVLNIVAPAIQKPSITIPVISNIVNNTTQTITLSYTNGGDTLANTSITITSIEPAGLQASITSTTASNFVVRISPSSSYVGIVSITISASNTAGDSTATLVLNLTLPITKANITIPFIGNIVNNTTQTITLSYTNGGDTLANTSITITSIEPAGLQASITSTTASNFVVRISPSSSYVGIASITISASNTAGDSTATLVLNIVAPAIQKPSITIPVISNIVNNTTQTITLSYTNGGDTLANTSITITSIEPAGLQASITSTTASNFVVRISPSSSYVGIVSITISASNTAGDSTATLVLNIVAPAIQKPSITISVISNIVNNTTQTITLSYTNGGDILANTSITLTRIEPAGLQASITNLTANNFVVALSPSSSYVGIVSITISASNTAGESTATLVLNIVAPAIQKPSITISVISNIVNNTTQTITLSYTNGGDTLANTSITITSIDPAGLQASITSTTASNFVVALSPSASYVGVVSITISASNTAGATIATLVLNLTLPITKANITIPFIGNIVNNTTQTITLSYTNGGDTLANTSITISRIEPRGLQASITSTTASNFVVRISPSSSYVGIASITISASNTAGDSTATLVLNIVAPAIQKPSITIPVISNIVNNTTQTITLSYTNGGDTLANTSITISRIEPTRLTSKYYQHNSK